MGASRDVSEERGSPEGGQTTHRGPPPDQMSNMKHKGISHTRSHGERARGGDREKLHACIYHSCLSVFYLKRIYRSRLRQTQLPYYSV